jgi:hypothetical protein
MSNDLQQNFAAFAREIASAVERLQDLEQSAAALRQDVETLGRELEGGEGPLESREEWGQRVPTRPLAVGFSEENGADTGCGEAQPRGGHMFRDT